MTWRSCSSSSYHFASVSLIYHSALFGTAAQFVFCLLKIDCNNIENNACVLIAIMLQGNLLDLYDSISLTLWLYSWKPVTVCYYILYTRWTISLLSVSVGSSLVMRVWACMWLHVGWWFRCFPRLGCYDVQDGRPGMQLRVSLTTPSRRGRTTHSALSLSWHCIFLSAPTLLLIIFNVPTESATIESEEQREQTRVTASHKEYLNESRALWKCKYNYGFACCHTGLLVCVLKHDANWGRSLTCPLGAHCRLRCWFLF